MANPIHPTASDLTTLNPISAYDAFAPYYGAYSESRRNYLRKVEEIVILHTKNFRSLLDVGAGDGSRALRIAKSAGIARLVLLEPSAKMRSQCALGEIWPFSAQDIPHECPSFAAIICLWNVLGHVQGTEQRELVLSKLKNTLSPGGALFLDVTHRYNAASYGWSKTLFRSTGDLLARAARGTAHKKWPDARGDVVISWQAGGEIIRTYGHVFTHGEMKRLFASAGLRIQKRWVIHYDTGQERRFTFCGNLLYKLTGA